MRILFSLALAAAFFADRAYCASLTGSVLDPSGRPIPRAEVSLFSRDQVEPRRSLSSDTGGFAFDRLVRGQYVLQVQAPGFARYKSEAVTLAAGAALSLDVSLTLASQQDEVVVTASGTPQNIDEVSKSVSVLSRESIEQRDEFFIPETLRTTPGIRVQQLGGPGAFTVIRIRGLRTEDTGILIDGFRFRDPTSPQGDASGFLEDLVVTDLDRVEVLRGSASALYGTNSIGGVVNIVTDQGGGPMRGGVLLEGGGLGLFRGRAQLAGGALGNRLQYSAGFAHLNVIRGVDGDDPARNTSGQGYVAYRITPNAQISGRFFGADSFAKLNTDPQGIGSLPPTGIVSAISGVTFAPAADDPDSSRGARFLSGAVILSGRSAGGLAYSLSYQGLNTNAHFPNGPAGSGFQPAGNTNRENDGTTHVANGRLSAQLGSQQLFDAGYEFENEHYVNRNFPFPANESVVDVSENSHAFFIQDQVRLLGDKLQIAGVFRAQLFSLSRPVFTPAASAPYQNVAFQSPPAAYTGDASIAYFLRSSGTKIRAHAGRGYRAPSLYERFGTFYSSFGYGVYGDPRLSSNRSIGGDAGVDQSFANGRVHASATYFYTRLQQVIGFGSISGRDPFGRFIGYLNQGGGIARGVEAGLSAAPTRSLELSSAYTFTNSRQATAVVPGVARSLIIPDHQFSVTATQHVGQRLYLNFDFTAASNYLAELFDQNFTGHAYRFPGMKKVDIGASYRIPLSDAASIRVFANTENVFDQRYFESGFRTPGVLAKGGLQFSF